ncbi:MAG: DnaD domain protein [Clostridiaceae bacterium]|jgi:DnaD/phage-associated family protein|nr:DnaD domain protein [Bacillota bacterium]NLN51486.1 DnaD domain protein [Clostridiaceae bacterium]
MRVSFNSALHLSDTLVPDLFITEYMRKLSGTAISCYLMLLLTFQHGNRKASPSDLAQRLGISESKIEQALTELQQLHLIVIQSGQIELIDIKLKEIKRNFTDQQSDEQISETQISEREAIIRQVNDTFFQGVMALGFYTKIDEWFNKYQFEPEVVYAIFSEAASKNKLDGPGYVSGIADNWGKQKIKTYSQLHQYYQNFEARRNIINKIRKQLNLRNPLNRYQEQMIDKWLEQYKFDFEIIDLAMAQTVNASSPSFRYIDSILTAWHKKELKTVEAIEEDLANYRKQAAQKRQNSSQVKGRRRLKTKEQAEQDVPEEELYRIDLIQRYSEAANGEE